MSPDRNPEPDDAASPEDRDYSLRAVDRVCAILDLLQQSVDGISLNTVVEATGMPKSSAYRYLWTLEQHRYVERDEETGLCRLGLGFLGMQSRHLELLRECARPWLEKLRDDFGETANLGVLDSDRIIYVDIVESRRGVRLSASRGDRDPLHSTALGKAIAAHLAEDRIRDVLARSGMPRRCTNTITSIDDYLTELASVRGLGYAVDNLENEADGRCVAVPLLGASIPAAISLSAPAARFPAKDVGKAAKALLEVAARIVNRPRAHTDNGGNDIV
ncbi:IclR family transcriptional regulator [Amycolatopsis acididurans]|uniref:IclR family transcriptional regulator n=1 Tax=Amycolatopsis acididurans TaxID=2724524 RepID=UPI0028B12F23|nr:IclR family transcriptional regulator [Amycolatopsis acididurans]